MNLAVFLLIGRTSALTMNVSLDPDMHDDISWEEHISGKIQVRVTPSSVVPPHRLAESSEYSSCVIYPQQHPAPTAWVNTVRTEVRAWQ